jgi:hypothetical protein
MPQIFPSYFKSLFGAIVKSRFFIRIVRGSCIAVISVRTDVGWIGVGSAKEIWDIEVLLCAVHHPRIVVSLNLNSQFLFRWGNFENRLFDADPDSFWQVIKMSQSRYFFFLRFKAECFPQIRPIHLKFPFFNLPINFHFSEETNSLKFKIVDFLFLKKGECNWNNVVK